MPLSARKTGILLVAFGSSTPTGQQTLALFDQRVRLVFPDVSVRWAFTSDCMRGRLAAARKKTDSVKKALCRMGFERYTHVAVQSLHLIPGKEYGALLEEVADARKEGGPAHIAVGSPLLFARHDVERAAGALIAHLPAERLPDEAVLCMAHGTKHDGGSGYDALAASVAAKDKRVFIGALEGTRDIDHLLPELVHSGVTRVWLLPLLAVVGKHAETDMAGEHPRSWRGRLESEKIRCIPVLKGTAEYTGFVDIWIDHLDEAMAGLQHRGATRKRGQTFSSSLIPD